MKKLSEFENFSDWSYFRLYNVDCELEEDWCRKEKLYEFIDDTGENHVMCLEHSRQCYEKIKQMSGA